jgi:hypothetical protein
VQSSSCEASTSSRFDEVDDAESHDDTLTPLPSAVPSGPLPGLMWGLDFNKTYMNCSYVPHYSEPTRIEEMEQVENPSNLLLFCSSFFMLYVSFA